MLSRVVNANNVPPHVRNAGSQSDDVKRDIVVNFMFTWHKPSFLIGQFKFEV